MVAPDEKSMFHQKKKVAIKPEGDIHVFSNLSTFNGFK